MFVISILTTLPPTPSLAIPLAPVPPPPTPIDDDYNALDDDDDLA